VVYLDRCGERRVNYRSRSGRLRGFDDAGPLRRKTHESASDWIIPGVYAVLEVGRHRNCRLVLLLRKHRRRRSLTLSSINADCRASQALFMHLHKTNTSKLFIGSALKPDGTRQSVYLGYTALTLTFQNLIKYYPVHSLPIPQISMKIHLRLLSYMLFTNRQTDKRRSSHYPHQYLAVIMKLRIVGLSFVVRAYTSYFRRVAISTKPTVSPASNPRLPTASLVDIITEQSLQFIYPSTHVVLASR